MKLRPSDRFDILAYLSVNRHNSCKIWHEALWCHNGSAIVRPFYDEYRTRAVFVAGRQRMAPDS